MWSASPGQASIVVTGPVKHLCGEVVVMVTSGDLPL